MKKSIHNGRPGFTLIEIMVATAISIVLVLGVVQIASSSMNAYNNAMSLVSTTATSRQVLDTLETDIQSAVIRNDGNVWLECRNAATNPSSTGNYDIQSGDAKSLILFSTPLDRDRFKGTGAGRTLYAGDVCAIRYQLANNSPLPAGLSSDDKAYCLYRLMENSEDTYNNILKETGDSSKSTIPSSFMLSKANNTADIFGINVVGMTPVFVFKKTDTSTTPAKSWYFYAAPKSSTNDAFYLDPKNFSTGFGSETSSTSFAPLSFDALLISGGKYLLTNSSAGAKPTAADWKDGTLVAVIVSINIVDDTGASLIRAAQQRGNGAVKIDAAEWDKILLEHGKTFVRRINLPGA